MEKIKNIFAVIGAVLSILFLIPFIVGIIVSFEIVPMLNTESQWIGFWGNYTGSLLGGIITLLVLFVTIKENKKIEGRRETLEYFDHVVELYSKYASSVGNTFNRATKLLIADGEDRKEFIYNQNEVAKIVIELDIQLKSRKMKYDVQNFLEKFDGICCEVNDVIDRIENLYDLKEIKKEYYNELFDVMNLLEEKILETGDLLTDCYLNNL